jgi:hypothetical protein
MPRTFALTTAVAIFAACALTAQGPPPQPPAIPPATNSVPPIDTLPVVQGPPATPPVTEAPPVQNPPATPPAQEPPTTDAPAPPRGIVPMTSELTREELRQRRQAIFLMEGVLANAVKLGAQYTASEIQRVQPGLMMFSAGPVKALGTYLEGYGVFFQVEIPSVIPSVASLLETLGRDRLRPNAPAQPTALAGGSSPEALMNPDAHYVESVKAQLVNAMVRLSHSLELRPDEWLTVSARDGSESPGQLSEPSTMILRIKGADLADFFAGRISLDEARRRVQVRGF